MFELPCTADIAFTQKDGCTWAGPMGILTCREEYFGLRVRKTEDPTQAINIPVNITVGTSGIPSLTDRCLLIWNLRSTA